MRLTRRVYSLINIRYDTCTQNLFGLLSSANSQIKLCIHNQHKSTIQQPHTASMPLPTGTYETCNAENEQFRPHPFYRYETCMECRTSHPDYAIIGVTDIKKDFKLKERELSGLAMKTEPKPAFLGGPDKRWYKLTEVEKKAEEMDKKKEKKEVKRKTALEKKKKTGLNGEQDVKKKRNGTEEKRLGR